MVEMLEKIKGCCYVAVEMVKKMKSHVYTCTCVYMHGNIMRG